MRGLLAALLALLILPAAAQAAPTLSGAHFEGLTRIVATSSEDLSGVSPAEVTVTAPGGSVTPAAVHGDGTTLTVDLPASAFARTTSTGTTIAARGSAPVAVARPGEPAVNAHILGSSQWTDNGWSTSLTDPSQDLYRFQDITPNADDSGAPVVWSNGEVTKPAHRDLRMLVLFVQFPNRLAANSPAGWQTMQPYMDFLQPASAFWNTSSYGQLNVKFESPQAAGGLPWITMDSNANLYTWDAQTHNMFAYAREAFQKAYDQLGIKADDYDEVLIMPARGSSGLANGPGNINRDPTDGEQTNTNQVAYVDHAGVKHYVSTVITAGNDMFSWGYRWINHEFGHTVGLPDLYIYSPLTVEGTRVNQFFWVGGWNIMGNIGGHANDYSGFEKYKLRWIRDDQVDVVSQPGTTTHAITPLETPGGSKIVVVRTGVSTAYVAELRTKLGVDGLDNRGKYQGVLLYKIDASQWEQIGTDSDLQIISKQYYDDPAVGGPLNKTGVWRPINNSLSGLDTQGALWGPGDTFEDPATGVKIDFGAISHYDAANPANSPYTADDTATISVTKADASALSVPVTLSGAKLTSPTTLHVDTSVELQRRIADSNAINNGHYVYVREESPIKPSDVALTRADGSAVPVSGVTINPDSLDIAIPAGTFPTAASAQGLKLATKAFYYFAASAPVAVTPQLADVGGTVPATLSLTLSGPASFGAFTPGADRTYEASTTASVISTAGDAALSVSDPGHLANGAFSLPDPLQVTLSKTAWTAPVSNDTVDIAFKQHIGANDALRTGAYARTVTFTLSTTNP
jgi:M6 family metalloprotease-like protein